MRTTINIEDQLLKLVKKYALNSGKSFTAVVEEALRIMISAKNEKASRVPIKLTTFKGPGGVLPGVDLDDSSSLLDLMDEK